MEKIPLMEKLRVSWSNTVYAVGFLRIISSQEAAAAPGGGSEVAAEKVNYVEHVEAMQKSLAAQEQMIVEELAGKPFEGTHFGVPVKRYSAVGENNETYVATVGYDKDNMKKAKAMWIMIESSDGTIRFKDNLDGIPDKMIRNNEHSNPSDRRKENDYIVEHSIDDLFSDEIKRNALRKRDLIVCQVEASPTTGPVIKVIDYKNVNELTSEVPRLRYANENGLRASLDMQQDMSDIMLSFGRAINDPEDDQSVGQK